jgi:hypothetical protein
MFSSQVQWLVTGIPTTQEVEIGRIAVQGQCRHKGSGTFNLINKLGWWGTPVCPAMWKEYGSC